MTTTNEYKKVAQFLIVTAAIGIGFFTVSSTLAHAEESTVEATTSTEVTAEDSKRAEMKKQIEALRAAIAEKKAAFSIAKDEYKEEKKAEFKVNKEEFMASLEGLTEEEKRAAMMKFIADIKAQLELKKAEHTAKKEEFKEQRTEAKDEFKASLEGLSREEKMARIMERVAAIKKQIEEKKATDTDEDESEEDEETEDETTDDSQDESEDDSDETAE